MDNYDELLKYAEYMIRINRCKTIASTTPHDCVMEGMLLNQINPKKGIVSYILTEKRKELARMQYLGIIKYNNDGAKICSSCNNRKSLSEYQKVTDQNGFTFYKRKCKSCLNKRRRELYNDEYKAKAKIRYERWKAKQNSKR